MNSSTINLGWFIVHIRWSQDSKQCIDPDVIIPCSATFHLDLYCFPKYTFYGLLVYMRIWVFRGGVCGGDLVSLKI